MFESFAQEIRIFMLHKEYPVLTVIAIIVAAILGATIQNNAFRRSKEFKDLRRLVWSDKQALRLVRLERKTGAANRKDAARWPTNRALHHN